MYGKCDLKSLKKSTICNDKNNNMVYNLIDTGHLKEQMQNAMGIDRFNEYIKLAQRYFKCELGKWEFDYLFKRNIGERFMLLHNQMILSTLWNARVKHNKLLSAHS